MTKKTFVKIALLCLLLVQGVVGVASLAGSADAAALCLRNSDDGCDNNGCEGTGGVCGRAIASPALQIDGSTALPAPASPCWCLY